MIFVKVDHQKWATTIYIVFSPLSLCVSWKTIIGYWVGFDLFLTMCEDVAVRKSSVCVCTWCVCPRQRSILCSHHFTCRQKCLTAVKYKIASVIYFFLTTSWNSFYKVYSIIIQENTALTADRKHTLRIFKCPVSWFWEASGQQGERIKGQTLISTHAIEHDRIKSGRWDWLWLMDIHLLPGRRGV